jgi:hypothetical protein
MRSGPRPVLALAVALTAAAAVALVPAPAAIADSAVSPDWAGYVAHGRAKRFSQVSALWKVPTLACKPPARSYSAMWTGLGGYGQNAVAGEEVGTEADCSYTGKEVTSAWYALLPARSRPVSLRVVPGDVIGGSVQLSGHAVTVTLADLTTGLSFTRTVNAAKVDNTSADWILEAPSRCISATACQTLPLANFGMAEFGVAFAQTTSGHLGGIGDARWVATKVTLNPAAPRFSVNHAAATLVGGATPSALGKPDTSFTITYKQIKVGSNPFS